MIPPGMITDPSAPTTRVRPVLAGMGVRLYGSSSGYAGLKPAAAAGSTEWELPSADGSSGQYLQTNGSGVLSWASVSVPTFLATGTDRSVQVRNGTGNSYTDSLLTVADTTGVASLTGTAAAYRAYGPTGVPYVSMLHDGTKGSLATSSGDLSLSPASGVVSIPTGSNLIKWGVTGTGLQLSMTTGANPQLDVRNFDNTIYGRVRAHTYYMWDGSFLYTDGTAFSTYKSNGSTYSGLYTGNQRIYDTSLNTAYLTLRHDGTEGIVSTSGGALRLIDGVGTVTCIGGTTGNDVWRFENSTNPILRTRAGAIIGFTASTSTATAALDAAIARRSGGGGVEFTNGTAGTLRDVYFRSGFGMAQAATDTPGCDKGALAQSANLREWQDSTGAVLASVSENGYFTTRKNAAPADAEIATGEAAYWFDSTNGAAKFMIKAKQANGTVVTGSVALA